MSLYLLCGLAFSGKTTLAAVLARDLPAVVVSLDAINASRGLDGGAGIPEEEWARTHQEALGQVERALQAGESVIVDDTNCFRFLRDNYRSIADRYRADTIVIYLDAPLARVRERIRANDQTRSRGSIADSVLMDLAEKFELPAADEEVLVVPADASPEVWVDHVLARTGGSRE
jgi:predicted kinase